MFRFAPLFSLLFAAMVLAQTAPVNSNNLDATLYVQTSTEWRMNCLQSFRLAQMRLDEALAQPQWTAALEQTGDFSALPPAVILDIDETVLDNSPAQAEQILRGGGWDEKAWDRWVASRKAEALPGALAFIQYARAHKVEVFYVTNRACAPREGNDDPCPQNTDTVANLQALGFPDVAADHLLLKTQQPEWGSEKESRRKFVSERYRVLLLIGDDLGDFMTGVKGKDQTPEKRLAQASAHEGYWGVRWIALTNPTYGSWRNVLGNQPSDALRPPKP